MPGSQMSPIKARMRKASCRAWLSGLAVTLTTIIAYLAFWRLAPVPTFIIGCVALIAMLIAAWIAGGTDKPTRRSEKPPPGQSDRVE